MLWIAWGSLTHPWYNIKHTLDYIQTQFSGLFSSIKINAIITCKCWTTLEGLHFIMLIPFDLASCISADVKHSYRLGKFFSVQMQYCISGLQEMRYIVELDLNGFSLFGKLEVNRMFYTNRLEWFGLHSCICFIYI